MNHLPLKIRSAMSAGISRANRDNAMQEARRAGAGMRQLLVQSARLQNHYMLAFIKIAKEAR
jgi:hypothetical protein